MTQAPVNPAAEAGRAVRSAGPTPGELLRNAREQRGVSLQQAAEDLHLDSRLLEAMEDDRFAVLGAPVYARGHLRKYASLLGLEPAQVLERYEALSDRPEVPTPVPVTTGTPLAAPRPSLMGPMIILAVLIALAIGWWAWSNGAGGDGAAPAIAEQSAPTVEQAVSTVLPAVDNEIAAPAVTETPPVQPETPVPAAPASTATAPASVATATTPATNAGPAAAQAVVEPASAPVAAAGQIRVQLDYRDACWTEVHDAQGRRLVFGLGAAGDSRIIVGTPPLRVTLGLASAVSLQVDGQAVVIPRQAGRNASYFTLAGDGTAQMIR